MDHETRGVVMAAITGAGLANLFDVVGRVIITGLSIWYIWLKIQKLKRRNQHEREEDEL